VFFKFLNAIIAPLASNRSCRKAVIHSAPNSCDFFMVILCIGPPNLCARQSFQSLRNPLALLYPLTGNSQELVFAGHDAHQTPASADSQVDMVGTKRFRITGHWKLRLRGLDSQTCLHKTQERHLRLA